MPVTVTPEPGSIAMPAESEAQSHFVVRNSCPSSSGPWDMTASGAGAVVSVQTPSPSILTLDAGAALEVIVALTSGPSGSGTVQLTATFSGSPSRTSSGTQSVTVSTSPPSPPSPPPPTSTGLPFGPFSLWKTAGTTETIGVTSFTASHDFTTFARSGDRSHILTRIDAARAKGLKLVLAMTGGGDRRYTTDGRFDLEKWKHGNPLFPGSGMDGYDTSSTIKNAVAQAVADGVILGNSVMDEPSRSTSWGPMTKPGVDSMCAYVKRIFPTLPVGVIAVHWWRPQEHYGVCDFIVSQFEYDVKEGGGQGSETPAAFRDAGLAMAAADGVSIVFSMNLLGGGPTAPGCTRDGKDCLMSPGELREAGLTLGPAGSGLLMWRYDATIMGQAAYQSAMEDVAADLRTRPVKSWRRSP
jgi:hypothetical protein